MPKAKKPKPPLLVPIRADGSLLGWPDPWSHKDEQERRRAANHPYLVKPEWVWDWRENFVFEDELVYTNYGGGRSAMSMWFKSATTGATFPMFWKHFEALVRRGCRPGPTFAGKWTFGKQGQNYSVVPLLSDDLVDKINETG